MTDVIDFLERLGQDAALRGASLESALQSAGMSTELRVALANRDQRTLEALLGVGNVCCLINAPTEEEQPVPPRKDARAA
jgi:hypothetical protein